MTWSAEIGLPTGLRPLSKACGSMKLEGLRAWGERCQRSAGRAAVRRRELSAFATIDGGVWPYRLGRRRI